MYETWTGHTPTTMPLPRLTRINGVAVVDGRVVAAGVDLGDVETEAARVAGRQDVAVIFVERGIHVYAHSAFGPHSR